MRTTVWTGRLITIKRYQNLIKCFHCNRQNTVLFMSSSITFYYTVISIYIKYVHKHNIDVFIKMLFSKNSLKSKYFIK